MAEKPTLRWIWFYLRPYRVQVAQLADQLKETSAQQQVSASAAAR